MYLLLATWGPQGGPPSWASPVSTASLVEGRGGERRLASLWRSRPSMDRAASLGTFSRWCHSGITGEPSGSGRGWAILSWLSPLCSWRALPAAGAAHRQPSAGLGSHSAHKLPPPGGAESYAVGSWRSFPSGRSERIQSFLWSLQVTFTTSLKPGTCKELWAFSTLVSSALWLWEDGSVCNNLQAFVVCLTKSLWFTVQTFTHLSWLVLHVRPSYMSSVWAAVEGSQFCMWLPSHSHRHSPICDAVFTSRLCEATKREIERKKEKQEGRKILKQS